MFRASRGMGNQESGSGRSASGELARLIYCVLPASLALSLHDPLREHFSDHEGLEVIVERRRRDRRKSSDRRRSEVGPPPEGERRRIRNQGGRRIADRRLAKPLPDAPALPDWALADTAKIVFVERFEPPTLALEDIDTARLVTRIQAGEEFGFATLYTRYFDRVYSYLRAALRDAHEAEDAAQQTFMKALEALSEYERRTQPFRGWLFAIARNCGTDCLRRGGRVQPLDTPVLDRRREGADPAPEPLADWLSDRSLARDFQRLPEPQQQVLMLRFLLDLSVRETAQVLSFSEDNVKTLQSRALRTMRRRRSGAGAAARAAV